MIKKIVFSVIGFSILVLFGYIYYWTNKTEGVWIQTYSLNKSNSSSDFSSEKGNYFSQLEIVVIKNFTIKTFLPSFDKSNPKKGRYFIFNKRVFNYTPKAEYIVEPVKYLKEVSKDSLVLNTLDNHLYIYKKIPDSLKSSPSTRTKLVNKLYKITSGELIDTIAFDESYFKTKIHHDPYKKWDSSGYEMIYTNGFEIILTGNDNALIVKENNGKLFMYKPTVGKDFKQIEFEEIRKQSNLKVNNLLHN